MIQSLEDTIRKYRVQRGLVARQKRKDAIVGPCSRHTRWKIATNPLQEHFPRRVRVHDLLELSLNETHKGDHTRGSSSKPHQLPAHSCIDLDDCIGRLLTVAKLHQRSGHAIPVLDHDATALPAHWDTVDTTRKCTALRIVHGTRVRLLIAGPQSITSVDHSRQIAESTGRR